MAVQDRTLCEIEDITTHISEEDLKASFSVRRYGKVFYIDIDPDRFVNSPRETELYLTYLALLKSGEDDLNEIYIEDVYEWIMKPFETLLTDLAPRVEDVAMKLTLEDWIHPDWFHFHLDLINEQREPHRIESDQSPKCAGGAYLDYDTVKGFETWIKFYHPRSLTMKRTWVFEDDVLFKAPKTLFIDQDEQTECFFKRTYSGLRTKTEVENYKKIQMAGLTSQFNICHCYGLVVEDNGLILGLLLKNIPDAETMDNKIDPETLDDPPMHIRQRLWNQVHSAVKALHENGIIWSDVKADNVLVDKDYNAWLIDFGPGYTEGWVVREDAGTLKGDLGVLEKLRKFLLLGEDVIY